MKNRFLKTFLWLLLAVVVAGSFIMLWKQSQPAPDVYEVIIPARRDISREVLATGVLESRRQVEIKPQITGSIGRLCAVEGQRVKKGDAVALIDFIPDATALNAAKSELETAEIDLREISREAERSDNLFNDGVVTRQSNEQIHTRLAMAQERVRMARNQLDVALNGRSENLSEANTTVVRSTMDGVVLSVDVKEGEMVMGVSAFNPGTTIAVVADMDDIIFNGNVDETQVAMLREGMRVNVVPASEPDVVIPAELEFISAIGKVENGTKMFDLKARVSLPSGFVVRSGYSVNAHVILESAEQALSVSETAVSVEDGETVAYRLTSPEQDTDAQQWERIPIELGVSDGIYVQVKSGISESDRLRGLKR